MQENVLNFKKKSWWRNLGFEHSLNYVNLQGKPHGHPIKMFSNIIGKVYTMMTLQNDLLSTLPLLAEFLHFLTLIHCFQEEEEKKTLSSQKQFRGDTLSLKSVEKGFSSHINVTLFATRYFG